MILIGALYRSRKMEGISFCEKKFYCSPRSFVVESLLATTLCFYRWIGNRFSRQYTVFDLWEEFFSIQGISLIVFIMGLLILFVINDKNIILIYNNAVLM